MLRILSESKPGLSMDTGHDFDLRANCSELWVKKSCSVFLTKNYSGLWAICSGFWLKLAQCSKRVVPTIWSEYFWGVRTKSALNVEQILFRSPEQDQILLMIQSEFRILSQIFSGFLSKSSRNNQPKLGTNPSQNLDQVPFMTLCEFCSGLSVYNLRKIQLHIRPECSKIGQKPRTSSVL